MIRLLAILIPLSGVVPIAYRWHDKDEAPRRSHKPEKTQLVAEVSPSSPREASVPKDPLSIIVGTFLGGEHRNYYGDSIGQQLHEIWKVRLGKGYSTVLADQGPISWSGAGWTGQPLIISENGREYLFQGSFDHTLKKIDLISGQVVWTYTFDDILKGTGTLWRNSKASNSDESLVIIQGSRLGNGKHLGSNEVHSLRGISAITGKELWRMNVKRGPSYSRDVDGSALLYNDTAYIGLENGWFTVFDPAKGEQNGNHIEPTIYRELPLFDDNDKLRHGGNLVTESSPARIGNHIYVTSGSGHVYGYNLSTQQIDWDFEVGSDLDGSPVVTADSCLIVTVEKQYIKGMGGAFKLDPSKTPEDAVVWYQPTGNRHYADWQGGIIGSACTNDHYRQKDDRALAAFTGIDGFLYVVAHNEIGTETVIGPNKNFTYPTPKLLYKVKVGPSISTPIFVGDKLLAAGYSGMHLFKLDRKGEQMTKLTERKGVFESTPVAHEGRVYIASRNGYFYCLGADNEKDDVDDYSLIAQVITEEPPVMAKPIVEKLPNATSTKPSTVAKKEPAPAVKTAPTVPPASAKVGTYYVIAGTFKNKSYALRLMGKLHQFDLRPWIMHTGTGMHYVSVASSENKEDMVKLKGEVEADHALSTWVYSR